MNREELHELLADAIIMNPDLDGGPYDWHKLAATDLVGKLWPVLAQVWDEGWETGVSTDLDGFLGSGYAQPNPYADTASSAT